MPVPFLYGARIPGELYYSARTLWEREGRLTGEGGVCGKEDTRGTPGGVSVIGDLMLQPWDSMNLLQADLGSVCVRARADWPNSNTPIEALLISSTRASALES